MKTKVNPRQATQRTVLRKFTACVLNGNIKIKTASFFILGIAD